MRLHIISFLALLLAILVSRPAGAQTIQTGTIITLNSNDSGNKIYKARERAILKPGYKYSAIAGNNMVAQIDETQVFNVSYAASLYDYFSFNDRVNATPTNDITVGTMLGSASVDLSGSANYNIPITTPPGTNGMVPELALNYNSTLGDGLMGYGWSLSGLSMISRSSKDLYHDGMNDPIKLITTDGFLLDGQRLILTTGTYGMDNSIYATENESFSKITAVGTAGNGPQWFKVELKNGLTMEYGNTSDARFMAEGTDNATVMYWRLNKVYDAYGNYMLYKYKNDQRDSRVDEILYTGNSNASLSPYNRIKFQYDQRTDKNTIYIHGSTAQTYYLLSSINITAENGIFKNYRLTYGKDQVDSYLKEIQEFGSDDAYLNKTIFKYNVFDPSAVLTTTSDLPPNPSGSSTGVDLIPGDYNGDGQMDLAYLPFNVTSGVKTNTSARTYISSDNVSGVPQSDPFIEQPTTVTLNSDFVAESADYPPIRQMYSNDFNGDGRDDILFTRLETISSQLRVTNIGMLSPNAAGDLPSVLLNFAVDNNYRKVPTDGSDFFATGDFDGDGMTDYVYSLDHISQPLLPKTLFTFPGLSLINIPSPTYAMANKVIPMDYNGDGRTDLLRIFKGTPGGSPGFIAITSFKRTTDNANVISEELYYVSFDWFDSEIFPGDFNGDGKTDLLRKSASNVWEINISKGKDGFQVYSFSLTSPFDIFSKITIDDYNGDGLSDIRHYNIPGGTNPPGKHDIYYSKGNGTFFYHQIVVAHDGLAPMTGVNIKGDFDGDGRGDVLIRVPSGSQGNTFRMAFFNDFDRGRLLDKVADGYNNVTTFTYSTLVQSAIHTKGTGSVYPIIDVSPATHVVWESRTTNGLGNETKTNYKYEGARVHLKGKGFLGFTKVTTDVKPYGYDYVKRSIQTFELLKPNDKYFISVPDKQNEKIMKFSITGAVLEDNDVSETDNTWDLYEIGNLRSYMKLVGNQTKNFITGAITGTTTTYDNATGNVTGAVNVAKKGPNIGDEVETVSTVYSSFNAYGAWIANKPGQVQVSKLRAGQPLETYTTTYGYSLQGKVSQQIEFFGLPKAVTTLYSYGTPFGNVTSEAMSALGLTQRVNTYSYDPKGRFTIAITNPLSQTATLEYDPRWGKPVKTTGVDGQTTLFEYDGFGSLKKTITPEGNQILSTWAWAVDNTLKSYYVVTKTMPGKPTEKIWYDKLSRNVKKHTEGFDGSWVEILTTFDSRGNVATMTSPHYQGALSSTYITSTNTYDKFNRISTAVNEYGTSSYAYSGLNGQLTYTITATDGQVRTTVMDAAGKTISSTDFSGTLNYTYDSWGNKVETKNGTIVLTSMTYDDYGRQLTLAEVNAGTSSYSFNAYGELVNQTNAKSETHTISYDVLGRVYQRVEPASGGTTTFEYYAAGNNGVNQVKKVTNFNGILEEYTYDVFNRLSTYKTTVDGIARTTTYGYNSYGDVTNVTYPSTLNIVREYNTRGYLTAVKNGTTAIFTGNTVDALGHYTNIKLVDDKVSTNTYDKFGFPDQFSTPGVQNIDFTFNTASGNLTGRNDIFAGKNETFTFNNNRLATNSINGTLIHSFTYLNNGNINSKTDAGTYVYNASKIHAVETVNNTSNFSSALQTISYTPFAQPNILSENGYTLTYTYGSNYNRMKGELKQNGTLINTRYYFGDYEVDITSGVTRHIHYIKGGEGLAGIVVQENGTNKFYAAYSDYLGSILKVTEKNQLGQVVIVAEQNFDAWGRYRKSDWSYYGVAETPSLPVWLYRGYCGHEHLPQFKLINMNGRLYDPTSGRMLSPDNLVSDNLSLQGFNRYSYAMNNPLKYTDPSGDAIHILVGAVIGAVVNVGVGLLRGEIHDGWDFVAYLGTGAAVGALGAATGGASLAATGLSGATLAGGIVSGAAGGAVGGAVQGAANATWQWARGRQSASTIAQEATNGFIWGAVSGAVIGGAVGGYQQWRAGKIAPTGPGFDPGVRGSGSSGVGTNSTGGTVTGGGKTPAYDIGPLTMSRVEIEGGAILKAGKGQTFAGQLLVDYNASTGSNVASFITSSPRYVYRSIDLAEWQSILRTGKFTPGPGYTTGKLFATNYQDALMYSKEFGNPVIVKAKIPAGTLIEELLGVDGLKSIYNVPIESLNKVKYITAFK